MTVTPPVVAAKARAQAARARLDETLSELQHRLAPSTLAHNAWATTVDRGADAWDATVERGTESLAIVVCGRVHGRISRWGIGPVRRGGSVGTG
jgi:hypothetical protein